MVWRSSLFNVIDKFIGTTFIGLLVEWKSILLYVFNMYVPCLSRDKKKVWSELDDIRLGGNKGEWCFVGDFNEVTSVEERLGTTGHLRQQDMVDFNHFIIDMEIVDVPVCGKKFTWIGFSFQMV